jgi:hypothetical protein
MRHMRMQGAGTIPAVAAQETSRPANSAAVPRQPLAQQARRLETALRCRDLDLYDLENPVFALVAGNPVRASRRSAEWCLNAVNQCWTQKAPRIRAGELEEARKAYDHSRDVYRQRLAEMSSGVDQP